MKFLPFVVLILHTCNNIVVAVNLRNLTIPIELPKGLFWVPESQCVYFIDIYKSNVHRYVPKSQEHFIAKVGTKPLSFVIPLKDQKDKFIISYGSDIATITWNGISEKVSDLTIITNVDPRKGDRVNNGKVSSDGVLFIGSDCEPVSNKASLYVYKSCSGIRTLIENVSISNGMAWKSDGSKFYYIDTPLNKVFSFDYTSKKCPMLSNEKILYDFTVNKRKGAPDGMTIDADGNLYVTCWDGGQILKINSEGKLSQTIDFPVQRVTSATFGGPTLDILYVTTAYYGLTEPSDKAGCLFEVTDLGVKGPLDVRFEL